MPFIEGSSSRIEKREDGLWHCVHCEFSSPRYQPVVGHLGLHSPNVRKPGRPKSIKRTDPLDLSITQLIMRLEDAEAERDRVQAMLHKERRHTADIRQALSAFMRVSEEDH
jgi:hypothetical protein